MEVSLDTFLRLAQSPRDDARVIAADDTGVRLERQGAPDAETEHKAAMKAFRRALSQQFGLLGVHAFDTVLGMRSLLHRPLRCGDVRETLARLPEFKKNRFGNELARLLDTHPQMLELPEPAQAKAREILAAGSLSEETLRNCSTAADIARAAADALGAALREVRAESQAPVPLPAPSVSQKAFAESFARADTPLGLRQLDVVFAADETSVEERVRSGQLGAGMRINRSRSQPVLLAALKTKGVEPGFVCRRDWSANDTLRLMMPVDSPESLAALARLKRRSPALAAKCASRSLRGQILLFGRRHPADLSAAAEYLLSRGMSRAAGTLFKAFCARFPDTPPEQWTSLGIARVKKALFPELRDAIMSVRTTHALYRSPAFRHFAPRYIVKLDFNEKDRLVKKATGSGGLFMRPERTAARRSRLGQLFYRAVMARRATDISVQAVTEALVNDLTRIAGIPAQELSVVRGQYSDGCPKLMLAARVADGYRDLGKGYLADGQIVAPEGETVESLGKYKAFFLATADIDAIGENGLNKGIAAGRFFAIDPGHSLDGNGRSLTVADNFSFRDSRVLSLRPRFSNFSVFDDDTRFAKLQGALNLRELKRTGKIEKLFSDYRNAFDPAENGISEAEKTLRLAITAAIGEKETEFLDNLGKVLAAASSQFKLFDALADGHAALQEMAIETIENLEKLTSPTTWSSPRGEVPLKHLAVLPESRVPWSGRVEGSALAYRCEGELPASGKRALSALAAASGAELRTGSRGEATLIVDLSRAAEILGKLSEDEVARLTHPEEAEKRARRTAALPQEDQAPVA